MAQEDLEGRILKCVDRGLLAIGENARLAVYWHIEQDKHLRREAIAREPRKFIEALEGVFGSGTAVLERVIVNQMKTEFGVSDDAEGFEEVVKEVFQKEGVAKG